MHHTENAYSWLQANFHSFSLKLFFLNTSAKLAWKHQQWSLAFIKNAGRQIYKTRTALQVFYKFYFVNLVKVFRLGFFLEHFLMIAFEQISVSFCSFEVTLPANIYFFKITNKNTRKKCEIYCRLTTKIV